MAEQHGKSIGDKDIFVPKEGQRDLLCCNKKSLRCPSLRYEYVECLPALHKAFDYLFDALIKSSIKSDDK